MRACILSVAIVLVAFAQAHADSGCTNKLNGSYIASNGNTLVFKQNCSALTITDQNQKTVWNLDLSGKTATRLPKAVLNNINAGKDSGVLLRLSGQSVGIRIVPKAGDNYHAIITGNFPLPNPARINENLLVEIRLEYDIAVNRWAPTSVQPENIELNPTAFALDGVITSSDGKLDSDHAFIQGANLILDVAKGALFTYANKKN
jgi:hypothetical protein